MKAIKTKYYQVPTLWSILSSDDYEINDTVSVIDELWIPSGQEVYGQESIPSYYDDEGRVQYTKKIQETTT